MGKKSDGWNNRHVELWAKAPGNHAPPPFFFFRFSLVAITFAPTSCNTKPTSNIPTQAPVTDDWMDIVQDRQPSS